MSNANFEKIKVEFTHDRQVLRITLADPPGNVLAASMMAEIVACLDEQTENAGLKAIVFEGEGKHFCFGASVEEHQKAQAPGMIHSFHGLFKKMNALAIPTFALVRGQCLGGGMELAIFCNFIFAEPSARFGQPEIVLGVFPPVAAIVLPHVVGQAHADDIILTGRSIDGATAQSWGLVHTVADDAGVALEQLIEKNIIPKSAMALRYANRASRHYWRHKLDEQLDGMERFYVDDLMETEDANEGIASFLEKRKPEWKNR